jgi:hypothetical protein
MATEQLAPMHAMVPKPLKREFVSKMGLEGKKFTGWVIERMREYVQESAPASTTKKDVATK